MSNDKKPGPQDATDTPEAQARDATPSHLPTDADGPRPDPVDHDRPVFDREAADLPAHDLPLPDLTSDAQGADPLADVPAPLSPAAGEAVGEEAEGPRPATPPDLSADPLHDAPREADPLALEEPLARAAEETAPVSWRDTGTARDSTAQETTPASAPHPMPTSSMSPRKGSGFLATLAGGMIAAALGGGVAWYLLSHQAPLPAPTPDGTINTRLNDQAGEISVLKSELARLASAPAPAAPAVPDEITSQIGALRQALEVARAQTESLGARLATLESRPPATEGAGIPADLEATIRAQAARNDQLSAAFDQLRTTTQQQLGEATAQGARAAQDAILARIAMAVTAGESYAPLLQQAEGVGLSIPEALRTHAGGVPDEPALKAAFPAAARAALDAATLADAQGAAFTDRATAFLRNQLGVRSLAPREGTGPDAVLSRMQAAVEAGDFAAALSEAGSLPEQGRAAMQGWLDGASARVDAMNDVEGLQARIAE